MPDDPEMNEADWNDVYDELAEELYESIAKDLIWQHKNDGDKVAEMIEKFSELAVEENFERNDPNKPDIYVCALCRNNTVHRHKETRICCEMTGCLDLNLWRKNFSVEHVMELLGKSLIEHKNQAKDGGHECHKRSSSTEISVVETTEDW